MSKICYIFGAGEYFGDCPEIPSGAFIIAADGGYSFLSSCDIVPDLLLGDLDSLGYAPENVELLRFKPEKNDTDMALAIDEGIVRGFDTFHIFGGTGGRLDHTLANIQCIAGLSINGKRGFLHGDGYIVTAITDGTIKFCESNSGYISVFSHSNISTGVTETGLKYPLYNAELSNTTTLGVSNEFCGKESSVTVKSGTLIIHFNNA